MSANLLRWTSPAEGATPPRSFLARFERAGDGIRRRHAAEAAGGADAAGAAAPGYTSTVLRAARGGPPELVIVEEGDSDVGRAAFFRSASRDGTGAIGLYEALPGEAGDRATSLILDAALAWAAARGLGELVAPVDSSTWFAYRFALPVPEGSPDPPPYAWEPRNPPEYPERFRRHGFADRERFETVGLRFPRTGPYTIETLLAHSGRGWESAASAGFSIERLDGRTDPSAFLDELHPLCAGAFADNPFFEPLPRTLFRALYADALARTSGHLTFFARDGSGRLAGFVFAFPDRGAVVVKTVAVAPESRGAGLSSALLHAVFRAAVEAGVDRFVSALVRKGNTSEFLVKPHMVPSVVTWLREYVVLGREVPS